MIKNYANSVETNNRKNQSMDSWKRISFIHITIWYHTIMVGTNYEYSIWMGIM